MDFLSLEIKARCPDPGRIRAILKAQKARFQGLDPQSDTYFRVPSGRLKLREGNIENALIHYKRAITVSIYGNNGKNTFASQFIVTRKPLKVTLVIRSDILSINGNEDTVSCPVNWNYFGT